ncbi:MAG: TolC family protein [Fuerstiella sp.]
MSASLNTRACRKRICGFSASTLMMGMALIVLLPGCSRRFWRVQAENDTYNAISQKLNDPHWQLPRIGLEADPRSRFYDPYDPDAAPLPPDDPAANRIMHCVSGRKGYEKWHCYGDTLSVENPDWLTQYLGSRVSNPRDYHPEISIPKVTLKDGVDLTYIHSREYQTQLEDIYIQGLALTLQQFNFGTRFSIGGPASGAGGAIFGSNRVFGGNANQNLGFGGGINQQLSSGTQLSLEILNTITWQNGSQNASPMSVGWQITQPLLRQAGRKVVLESLTQSERDLLYEVRDMARFRQTLFVDVASDYLTLQQQAQLIRNQLDNIKRLEEQIKIGQANDQSRPLIVYADLRQLPPDFVIPEELVGKLAYTDRLSWKASIITEEEKELLLGISDDNRYQAAARELIGWRDQKTNSLGVQQLITQLNNAQNGLATQKNQLDSQLDAFKIRLGLPPDVQIDIDNSFLSRFELIDSDLLQLVEDLDMFQEQEGPKLLPDDDAAVSVATLRQYVAQLAEIRDQVQQKAIDDVQADFGPIREILAQTSDEDLNNSGGRSFRSVTERKRVIKAIAADMDLFRLNQRDFEKWSRGIDMLKELIDSPNAAKLTTVFDQNADMKVSESELPEGWRDLPPGATVAETDELDDEQLLLQLRKGVLALRERLKQVVQGQEVVQAGLRVEMVELNNFSLDGRTDVPSIKEVVNLGIQYRHDLMNTRAQVMDSRRQVEIAANDLKARLDLNVSGDLVDQGGPNDDLTVGVDFKTPIDQVAERNAYNNTLINYQRAKRAYLAQEDQVKQQIRNSWRQLRVSAEQLEIDRQTVRNAALQYDNIATSPNQSDNLSLLNALNTLLGAQNSLVNDWITYETTRLNIFRDMGIMNIDQSGLWQDSFYQGDEGEQPAQDQPATILEVVPMDFDNSVTPDNETQP